MTQKTTDEIRRILTDAKLDFNSVMNTALKDYLPKIFYSCPFTGDLCQTRQCVDCSVFTEVNKQTLKTSK